MHLLGVLDIGFSPDGRRVVTAGIDGAKVWFADDGREIASLARHEGG